MSRRVVAGLALIGLWIAIPSAWPTSATRSEPGGPAEAVTVAAGQGYTCAVTRRGRVECWGTNGSGQLGTGARGLSSAPVSVARLSRGALTVTAGEQHGCALLRGGNVWCWGANDSGELGDGSRRDRRRPVRVRGLAGKAVAVSAGSAHTCALLRRGAIECWGANQFGQLGDGSRRDRLRPARVRGLSGPAVAMSAGGRHTCAVLRSGALECWGADYWGQLGDGRAREHSYVVRVRLLSRVVGVDAGRDYTCAVLRGGGVRCWGANAYGQLGVGTRRGRRLPARVRGLSAPVLAVSAGERHTCALLRGGGVACWGANGSGQLGDGTVDPTRVAVRVKGVDGAATVTTGTFHTCALTRADGLLCWGMNASGELGAGTIFQRSEPVRVAGLSGAVEVAAGGGHTCARGGGGSIECWGADGAGQLGDRARRDSSTPVPVAGLSGPARSLAAGDRHTCAVTAATAVECWGANDSGQIGDGTHLDRGRAVVVRHLPADTEAVSAGESHTCALSRGGVVRCWGANGSGQLGDGSRVPRRYPVRVRGLPDVAAVSAGGRHTCALTTAGAVECWGANDWGQLGTRTRAASSEPVRVTRLPGSAAEVASGGNHTCARMTGGAIECWGEGYGSGRPAASRVAGAAALSAGGRHTCALTTDGRVSCWGANDLGQSGGSGPEARAVAVSAGGDHTCAVLSGGSVTCWGWNYWGQLGDGAPPASGSWTPVRVAALG